jgi:hypothetical protein
MPPGLTLKLQVSGDKEIAARFEKAGDAVRAATVSVFEAAGEQIVSAAQAGSPSKRARRAIFYRVTDKGSGRIRLLVDVRRRLRWVEQFEYGTVGTGGPDAEPPAHAGATEIHVRSYERRAAGATHRTRVFRDGKAVSGVWLVKAYDRLQHMPSKPFMGPAFRSVEGTIVPRLDKAIDAAIGFSQAT